MTPKRRTALQLGLLAVVIAAAAMLFLAGPACAPAAPGGQASGQVEPDATAEPTATATTAATNTPATEPSATAEATSMATPETTPTATGAPFTLRHSITGPFLQDSLDRYQNTQRSGAAGAAGSAGQDAGKYPDTALVVINTDRIDELVEFLAGKGIKPLDKVNGRPVSEITTTNADVVAEIPLALLPELSQQWIGGLELANPYYPVLSDAVYHYLARHQAGLPMDGEFLWVLIQVRKGQSFNSLKRFLVDNGSLMRYSGSSSALVPLSLLERLALRPESERITFVGGPFTTELINRARVALTRTPTPTPDPGPIHPH